MKLSEAQKKFLRGRGHDLKPLILIGDAGLTKAVLLCSAHHAELIQRIGNVALIYRANHDKKREKRLRIPSH
jgi:RNA-binding protein